jgi:hypothetical protein
MLLSNAFLLDNHYEYYLCNVMKVQIQKSAACALCFETKIVNRSGILLNFIMFALVTWIPYHLITFSVATALILRTE